MPDSPFPNIHHYRFGDTQGNSFTGGAMGDHLYGGDGDDTLSGGKKIGGAGNAGLWQSADKKYLYSLSTRTENSTTFTVLSIQGPDGGMWVKNWSDGQFGIELKDADTSQTQYQLVNSNSTTGPGQELLVGGTSNVTLTASYDNNAVFAGDGADMIFALASPGRQEFHGEGGDDVLQTGDGNDLLDGGTGDDLLDAGKGNDTLLGGYRNHIQYPSENAVRMPDSCRRHSAGDFRNRIPLPQQDTNWRISV